MGNNKKYISPAIKVVYMETAQPLAASGGVQPPETGQAKEHDSFFGFWGDEEDDEPSIPKCKSLWDE